VPRTTVVDGQCGTSSEAGRFLVPRCATGFASVRLIQLQTASRLESSSARIGMHGQHGRLAP
jgi:hypothetical protein